eukprot:scaffold22700_cov142-Isochrysis_galbana.AAC.2
MYKNKNKTGGQNKKQEAHAARPHRSSVQDRQDHRRCPPPGGQQGGVAGVQRADRGRGEHTDRHHPGGEGHRDLVNAGEQTSNTYMCAEQMRMILQEMREGVQAFDAIIVNTPEAMPSDACA